MTKGSFYWHFTDIAGYRAALIDAWGELRDEDRRHFGEMARMPPRERLSQMMSSLLGARHWTLERAMREWARTDEARGRQCPSSRPTDSGRRPPGVSRLRVRRRGRRSACQRHVRGRNRVSASVRADAERPRGGPSGALPRPHAGELTSGSLPYLKVWYVRRHDRCCRPRRRTSARSSSPGWPTARRKRRDCAGCPAPPSTTSSHRGSPSCWCPPATAACRRRGLRFSIRSAGWRTAARPAPGPSASTPCTTG